MGSFAYTCAVSGLPIHAGDAVRFLLLTENPYKEEAVCYSTGVWFPRTFPIRAKYNDYGSIDRFQEGPFTQNWLEGFQKDLVERGWGDNSCHDTSTSKDMNFAHLLEALQENRVLVYKDGHKPKLTPYEPDDSYQDPEGIPTIKRISEVIRAAGYQVFDGSHSDQALMIDDDQGYGCIRVRIGNYGDSVKGLQKVAGHIQQAGYGCLMTPGTGHYSGNAELMVRPKVGIKAGWYGRPNKEAPLLRVRVAIIREDVWQALIKFQKNSKYEWDRAVLQDYRTKVRQAWDRDTRVFENKDEQFRALMEYSMEVSSILRNEIPCSVGPADHFKAMAKTTLTDEEREEFLNTVAEMLFIQVVLSRSRYTWRPSYPCGPQFGEWDLHTKLYETFAKIATKARKKDHE